MFRTIKTAPIVTAALAAAFLAVAPTAQAGDCTGIVVGVRPISQYNHDAGHGFLAVRTGPGSKYSQKGELYRGDEVWVGERQGRWLYVGCMNGRCSDPLWGTPWPEGWAYDKYLEIGGLCF